MLMCGSVLYSYRPQCDISYPLKKGLLFEPREVTKLIMKIDTYMAYVLKK